MCLAPGATASSARFHEVASQFQSGVVGHYLRFGRRCDRLAQQKMRAAEARRVAAIGALMEFTGSTALHAYVLVDVLSG